MQITTHFGAATSGRTSMHLSGRQASFAGRRIAAPPGWASNRRTKSHARFELKAAALPDLLPPSPTRRPDGPNKDSAALDRPYISDKSPRSKRSLWRGIPCGEPPATGLLQEPLMVQTAPARYSYGTCDSYSTQPTHKDVNADTAAWLRGLDYTAQRQQLAIHYRKVPQAIGAAEMSPETAADNLTFVARYYGPLLEAKAPGGDSVLVAHPVGLVEMLEGALQCCDLLLMKEELLQPREALLTAAAAAEVLSHLSFGSQASAAPYQTIWLNLKTRLSTSAAALGPAAIPEEAVVGLYESCARGPLHMTPWCGHTFDAAAKHHLQAGFSGPKAALSFAESWATLVARGRFQFVPERFEAIMAAVLSHPLTDAQLKQALAIPALLPVEARLGVRSWGWQS